jgi:hypothetical protein
VRYLPRWLLALTLLAAPAAAPAQQVEEGKARFVPWSGYWWPHSEGRIIGPLRKYDLYAGTQAAPQEARQHPREGAEKWFGYCHAWSAAALTEREPRQSLSLRPNGAATLALTVGDQKGLLTLMHAQDIANVYGQRYRGPGDDINDVYPDVLWKYLKLYVKQRGLPLVMDFEKGTQVWNYPVYAYKVVYRPVGGDDYAGTMTIWAANDAVAPDYVGTKVISRTYTFTFKMRGGAVVMGSAQWTCRDHPDFAWYPYVTRPENPQVKVATVRKMLGLGRSPESGEPEPPAEAPVSNPADPPQPPAATPEPAPQPLPGVAGPAPATAVVSPTELLTLLTHKADKHSAFSFDITVDKFDGGKYAAGEPFWIQGTSKKAGYLYLFHTDLQGNLEYLFPMPGQDNRVPANSKFTIGKADAVKFACKEPVGAHYVRGLITTRPLAAPPLAEANPGARGQGQGLYLNPTLAEYLRGVVQGVQGQKLPAAGVEKETGVNLKDLPFEFAQDEVGFYVGAAPAQEKPRGR